MAVFNALHDVGQDLVDLLVDRTGIVDTLVGPPLDPPNGAVEAIRVTLLWVTPQPMHRNDLPRAGDDGTREQPLASLTAFYMISTYGTAADTDPVQAHNILGRVLQTFHSVPVLELPNPVTVLGEGRLSVVHQTTTAELLEKVFTPLQLTLRPWALFEVAPIQLLHQDPPLPAVPLVHPGGIHLSGVEVTAPPVLTRVTPDPATLGGTIRLDVEGIGAPGHVTLGGVRIPAANLTIPTPGGPIFVDLSLAPANTVPAGTHDLTVSTGTVASEPVSLTLRLPPVPRLDAPVPGFHSIGGGPLVLTGQSLITTLDLVAWPDEGLAAPTDVISLATIAAANQITVTQPVLGAANLRFTTYRLAARVGPHSFTPWVLLELRP
ncbi:MAG: DUF4255 domain-containing protein [Thermoleophilia bacterium]|nr:DUF4255 domain-containing protein [Thermoleophilia bacterium]